MSPAFSSWAAFFAMGGYAFYVWLAIGATLAALAGLIIHTLWQRRTLLAAVRRQQARKARMRKTMPAESAAAVPPGKIR